MLGTQVRSVLSSWGGASAHQRQQRPALPCVLPLLHVRMLYVLIQINNPTAHRVQARTSAPHNLRDVTLLRQQGVVIKCHAARQCSPLIDARYQRNASRHWLTA